MEKIFLPVIALLTVLAITATVVLFRSPWQSTTVRVCDKNLNGPERSCECLKNPELVGRLPEGRPVYGVQPYKEELYVIRESTPHIEVYDGKTFSLKRNMSVDNIGGPYDMVLSSHKLFIVDWFNKNNMTVVRIPEGTATQWRLLGDDGFTTFGLARPNIFTKPNILVTASANMELKKFGPSGHLMQQLVIQNISSPRQSIQVGLDRYAVCYGYGPPPNLHQVCLVDGAGETIKCHGTTNGSGPGQLNIPGRLEGNKNCILVADTGNKRVVLLTDELEYAGDLISEGLNGPYRLYLDEVGKRLYVADNTVDHRGYAVAGRVFIYRVE